LPPTSPISPPMDVTTPGGSVCRMNAAKSAARLTLTSCCSASVAFERSTSVEVSMSML